MSGFGCFLFALFFTVITLSATFLMEKKSFYKFYYDQLAENKPKNEKEPSQSFGFVIKETFEIYKNFGWSVWNYIGITFLNFCSTLCVFPAVCQLAESYEYSDTDWNKYYYVAVCCFVIFNLADYAGKQFAVWIQKPGPSKIGQFFLLLATLLKCGLIPLFMYSNVAVSNRNTSIVFFSDAWYITFVILLGVSNGYIGNIAMMFGPKSVKNVEHQGTAAAAIVATLVLGCGVGSVISNALVKAL